MRRALFVASAIAVAIAVFWGGDATAQTDNRALECTDNATFFPRGDHWVAIDTDGPMPIIYRQAAAGSDDITSSEAEQEAVNRAFVTWSEVACGSDSPNFELYDAYTFLSEDYPNQDRGDTEEEGFQNIVYFVESEANWESDSQTVALTTNLRLPDTESIVTSDMEFNGINYSWRARPTTDPGTRPPGVGAFEGCTAGDPYCYDVESVALHEVGHFLGLNHVTCSDAVMFPQGSGTQERTLLSFHEIEGICALYPPRPPSLPSTRWWGESCRANSDCPDNLCIESLGFENLGLGWCTKSCTRDADCPKAYVCAPHDDGTTRYCKPGPNLDGNGATGAIGDGAVDPTTGESSDLCRPCNAGSQCATGMCINDGETSICSEACSTAGGYGCENGFDCVATGAGNEACWPQDPVGCVAAATQPGLNDICYVDLGPTSGSYYNPCAADLVCFGFKPRCEGQQGACVNYCNDTDRSCPQGLTCCFGVGADGSCQPFASASNPHGGCFNVRRVGESCVIAENSICEPGAECFNLTGNATEAKCFQSVGACTGGPSCAAGTSCVPASDECFNEFAICCENEGLDSGVCYPGSGASLLDLGVECRGNAVCDSGLCLSFEGGSACSRSCNVATGEGCPGEDVDVNGDGQPDGGFICRLVFPGTSDPGRCWPRNGPIENLNDPGGDDGSTGGCCSAVRLDSGDLFVNALLWVPIVVVRLRRRRRG